MGYQTLNVSIGKTYAFATQFTDVSGDSIQVKNLVSVSDPVGAAGFGATADQIWRYNGTGWDYYFYKSSRSSTGWAKKDGTLLTDETIPAGESFIFVRANSDKSSDTTITIAGGVIPLTDTPTYEVKVGETKAMCYPWPKGLVIKNFNNYNAAAIGAAGFGATADQIWRYNGTGWDYYFFRSSRSATGWAKKDGTLLTDADVIPSGEGFFFVRANSDKATDAVIVFTAD